MSALRNHMVSGIKAIGTNHHVTNHYGSLLTTIPLQNDPVLPWKNSSVVPKGNFILYLKARKLVSKGCVYHLVNVNDSCVQIPPIQ